MEVSTLARLLRDHRERVVQRWLQLVMARGSTAALDPEVVIDSLREFLDEVAQAAEDDELEPGSVRLDYSRSAASDHGHQRFTVGFDIGTMIDEYRTLVDAVHEVVREVGIEPAAAEWRGFSSYIAGAAAASATHYSHARDLELQQQTARHLGFLAHELRNPLSTAVSGLTLLEQRHQLSDDQTFQRIQRSVTRLRELIDRTLVDARVRGKLQADRAPVHLERLIDGLLEESAADAEAKHLLLRAEVGRPDLVDVDPTLVNSAVSNLIRNAVKFSREGGTVVVRTRRAEGWAYIEVADECGGIPDEKIREMFDPFVQVGSDRSGFGLGLAIAKQAALAHDGDIRVHNRPGHGCVFVLELACEDLRRDPTHRDVDGA